MAKKKTKVWANSVFRVDRYFASKQISKLLADAEAKTMTISVHFPAALVTGLEERGE